MAELIRASIVDHGGGRERLSLRLLSAPPLTELSPVRSARQYPRYVTLFQRATPLSTEMNGGGGERKPISNSDQIRSAQKWRLSIPPDSSRRDEAPASNGFQIGVQTSPHAPPEVSAQVCYVRDKVSDSCGEKKEMEERDALTVLSEEAPKEDED
ncbi:hypothetical protein Acr_03g0013740 [Actinidia rufa]|uniref:Uncharacterized protein n=1 Tax=Actinidia rufa TaxID=165716 RepID=A0A7J0EE04_9ERIC|nr:hypothetical protein Acr_03g0013740 [Actinidia rufa]